MFLLRYGQLKNSKCDLTNEVYGDTTISFFFYLTNDVQPSLTFIGSLFTCNRNRGDFYHGLGWHYQAWRCFTGPQSLDFSDQFLRIPSHPYPLSYAVMLNFGFLCTRFQTYILLVRSTVIQLNIKRNLLLFGAAIFLLW